MGALRLLGFLGRILKIKKLLQDYYNDVRIRLNEIIPKGGLMPMIVACLAIAQACFTKSCTSGPEEMKKKEIVAKEQKLTADQGSA